MPITPLPTAPQRSDPANFAARADAFFAALNTFVAEFNSMVPAAVAGLVTGSLQVNGDQVTVQTVSGSFAIWKDATPTNAGRMAFNTVAVNALQFDLWNGSAWVTSMTLVSGGGVGIGTSSPTALLDVNSNTIRVRTARTPASATAAGNQGDIAWDATYLYICTATNTWRRILHATW